MPSGSLLRVAPSTPLPRRTKTYAAVAVVDAIKTAIATSLAVATYTGAALNGGYANPGPASFVASGRVWQTVSATTSAQPGAYNVIDPIMFTGTDADGTTQTESVYLTAVNGNETVAGVLPFRTVTSIAVPAQALDTGQFQFGAHDLCSTNRGVIVYVRADAAGNVALVHDGDDGSEYTDTIAAGDNEVLECALKRVSGATAVGVTVFVV